MHCFKIRSGSVADKLEAYDKLESGYGIMPQGSLLLLMIILHFLYSVTINLVTVRLDFSDQKILLSDAMCSHYECNLSGM